MLVFIQQVLRNDIRFPNDEAILKSPPYIYKRGNL